MKVQLIIKASASMTGTSRYEELLSRGLAQTGVEIFTTVPSHIPLHWMGFDLGAFSQTYPLRVKMESADIYHITTQTMATLLHFNRFPAPVVITVLDIIPYLLRNNVDLNTLQHPVDRWFYKLALAGLRKADALIAISDYTRQTLIDELGIPGERIHVVYPSVDRERFYPMEVSTTFYEKYDLSYDVRYLLYVGSEDPRKNLVTLIEAFAQMNQHQSNVRLLKVGRGHFTDQRARLLEMIARLGLQDKIHFIDEVPDDDLALFYNLADVLVMPSFYEGFGFPVLEAMTCGTPVVVSAAASLPEVVGPVGMVVDPHDFQELSRVLLDLCRFPRKQRQLTPDIENQLALFDRGSDRMCQIYMQVLGEDEAR